MKQQSSVIISSSADQLDYNSKLLIVLRYRPQVTSDNPFSYIHLSLRNALFILINMNLFCYYQTTFYWLSMTPTTSKMELFVIILQRLLFSSQMLQGSQLTLITDIFASQSWILIRNQDFRKYLRWRALQQQHSWGIFPKPHLSSLRFADNH